MLNIFKNFFDYNAQEVNRLKKKVYEINALEDKTRNLKDEDFKKETEKLKKNISSQKQTLDEILPWAYALVREAARRVLDQRHFDVQLIAAVALHEKKIVEQKTGEGKTLTATAALYLNALTGKGVHLVTVNDYLARRDAGWMGQIFHFLGMITSAIISDTSFIFDPDYTDVEARDSRLAHLRPISRAQAYQADITYGINSEFGFDYLRDNMVQSPDQVVQRGYYFAIIDEADSVLIDEARTPHIISAPYEEDVRKYYDYARIVKILDPKTDYVIDEKLRTANLTEEGIKKIEKTLEVSNIYEKDFDTLFHIEASLKAETLFKADKDYIVKDGEVIIVDEFTGRLLYGRRFSEGLHQAIEAKESVSIQRESKTLATVSLQNYFRMYEKLGGMTGTAATETEEFHKIYKVEVLTVPTHRPMIRKDEPDMIYKTERAKFNAVAEDIASNYKNGRPVLVGTTSIEKNERLSRLLHQKGIPHQVLNAKNHLEEAQIIAQAGEKGAVTVATNMAGRGVDIILGGAPPDPSADSTGSLQAGLGQRDNKKKDQEKWQKKHDEVVSVGGLYVIGTERHESRRIDNQLRGRSGRQGDPGETRFFVSLEDDLMRIFGGEQIAKLMNFLKFPEDQPLSHGMVSKAIEQSQIKVEGFNFDIRKHLVEYDDVLNKQREIVYSLRKKILTEPEGDTEEFRDTLDDIFHEEISLIVNNFMVLKENYTEEDFQRFKKELFFVAPKYESELRTLIKKGNFEELQNFLEEKMDDQFTKREKELSKKIWFDVIRMIFLSTIDRYWTEHLTAIDDLREGINLRGYAQLDPLVEYKNEAFSMFERLITSIYFEATRGIFSVEIKLEKPELKNEDDNSNKEIKVAKSLPNKKDERRVYQSASRVDPYKVTQQQETSELRVQSSEQKTLNPQPLTHNESTQIDGFKIIPPGTSANNLGRNDQCPCGSGKKWKKCHYPNIPA
ncbi:MAG: preprotein translocase subunit SecA [Candidatus Roizmanbacteria bacterium]|nr:MAG: preprotein translocase subunit SecA [Candidatus Roizmanbacteria bacterium]